ncbi:hypothetical protein J9M50_002538 [Salmonella enterica]|nr:hypothetical protein [Salmonella enterica]EHI9909025.1 hypothetical protein [Salmonella enterica]EHJ0909172.1 hypothetical protein [Salmonella enterica]
MVRVILGGTLTRDDVVLAFCVITLSRVDDTAVITATTTGDGHYSFDVPPGSWRVTIQPQNSVPVDIGMIEVNENTPPQSLDALLRGLTPETVSAGVLAFLYGLLARAERIADGIDLKQEIIDKVVNAIDTVQKAEQAVNNALEHALTIIEVHEAPSDGVCYVRQSGAWVQQGAFDVGVAASTGEVNSTAHQLFTLDGTKDNTVTFTGLPAGRAMVIALVFKGAGGVVTWPDDLAWSQNDPPKLADTRTVISILWDGENLTGTTALTV